LFTHNPMSKLLLFGSMLFIASVLFLPASCFFVELQVIIRDKRLQYAERLVWAKLFYKKEKNNLQKITLRIVDYTVA